MLVKFHQSARLYRSMILTAMTTACSRVVVPCGTKFPLMFVIRPFLLLNSTDSSAHEEIRNNYRLQFAPPRESAEQWGIGDAGRLIGKPGQHTEDLHPTGELIGYNQNLSCFSSCSCTTMNMGIYNAGYLIVEEPWKSKLLSNIMMGFFMKSYRNSVLIKTGLSCWTDLRASSMNVKGRAGVHTSDFPHRACAESMKQPSRGDGLISTNRPINGVPAARAVPSPQGNMMKLPIQIPFLQSLCLKKPRAILRKGNSGSLTTSSVTVKP